MIQRAFWLIVLLAVLLGAADLGVEKFFPPERMQAIAEQQLQIHLHRAVRLVGLHLHFSGLAIDHLEVSETPNFKAGTFLVAKQCRLAWALMPLLKSIDWKTRVPESVQGRLTIGTAVTPFYRASDLTIDWDLHQVEPTGTQLTGKITLDQGPGVVYGDKLMHSTGNANIVLIPLKILQELNGFGMLSLQLPKLKQMPISRIQGDYTFGNGVMTIQSFTVTSPQLTMHTVGTVTLASQHDLALDVALHLPSGGHPLDAKLRVTGTADHPQVDLSELKKKAFRATIQNLLSDPQKVKDAANSLKKLFQ